MNGAIVKVWTFKSDSNPDKTYETLKYADGSTSCNCFGWTRRFINGVRSCKHTRLVDQNMADSEAISFHDYDSPKPITKPKSIKPKKVTPSEGRRILWQIKEDENGNTK